MDQSTLSDPQTLPEPQNERRKFVFVFTGPAGKNIDGQSRGELMQGVVGFAHVILRWEVESQYDLPLSARVHIEEASES